MLTNIGQNRSLSSIHASIRATGRVSLHEFRSFVTVSPTPKERDRSPPNLVTPEAYIRWGQASDFSEQEFEALTERYGYSDSKQKDVDQKRPRINCQGGLTFKTWTVVNPENPECYVVLEAATRGQFEYVSYSEWQGKPGRTKKYTMPGENFVLHMNPLPPNTFEGDGQTPEAPPDIGDIEA